MTAQPDPDSPASPEQDKKPFDWRGYFRSVGKILIADLVAVGGLVLIFGPRTRVTFANHLFWSAFLLLGVAALPELGGLRSGLTLPRHADSTESLRALMKERREKRRKDEPLFFTFGAAGLLVILLSLVLSF